MNQLPVQRASELSIDSAPLTHWLVQGLWSDQAVGILGGEPKCCKSFLALDLAVSVASGTPCSPLCCPAHRKRPERRLEPCKRQVGRSSPEDRPASPLPVQEQKR